MSGADHTIKVELDRIALDLLRTAAQQQHQIISLLQTILREVRSMNATVAVDIPSAIAELQAATASVQTVVGSAETLISGIPALIAAAVAKATAAGATPDQLASFDALSQQLQSAAAGLAAAVAANTPAPSGATLTTAAGPSSAAPTGAGPQDDSTAVEAGSDSGST